ncbi:MAG: hypothetical protein WA231_09335 [Methylocella sp.]
MTKPAHLLFHTSGIDTLEDRYIPALPDRSKRIEFLCNRFAARFLVPEAGSGGNPFWNKISYLGRDYITLAFNQYHQNRIDDVQLAEYLDTKPKNLGTLEEYFSKSSQ